MTAASNSEAKRQNVGKCPRCAYPIVAEVYLTVTPGAPFQDPDNGRWCANAMVHIATVRVEHFCSESDPNVFDSMLGGEGES